MPRTYSQVSLLSIPIGKSFHIFLNYPWVMPVKPSLQKEHYKRRREKLIQLVHRYGGNKRLSEAMLDGKIENADPNWISQVKTGVKNLGEDKAREIEKALNLDPGWFDDYIFSGVKESVAKYGSEWPFSIDRRRYDRLTEKQKQRINGALQLMIIEIELENQPNSPKNAGERRHLYRG